MLWAIAWGENFERAIAQAYAAIDCIHYEGKYYWRDIGYWVRTAGLATDLD